MIVGRCRVRRRAELDKSSGLSAEHVRECKPAIGRPYSEWRLVDHTVATMRIRPSALNVNLVKCSKAQVIGGSNHELFKSRKCLVI